MSDPITALCVLGAFVAAFVVASILAKGQAFAGRDKPHRIGTIDGLRGYLALGVAIHHFTVWQEVLHGRPWDGLSSNPLNNLGQSSVALFFMITGVLFYRIVSRRGLATDWASLYISRIFRLTPMLWVVTALVVLFVLAHGGVPQRGDWLSVTRWLLFLGNPDLMNYPDTRMVNAGVLWTLKYAIAFYVALPLSALATALITSRAARLWTLAVLTVLLMMSYDAMAFQFQIGLVAFFLLGIIASEIADSAALADWLRSPVAALIGTGALLIQMFGFHSANAPLPAVLLMVAFVPVVAGNSYFGLLRRPGSLVLGEISYSIYMLHGIILSVLMIDYFRPAPGNPDAFWTLLPLVAIGIVLAAALSFVLIERPFIKLGKSLAGRVRSWRLGTPALRSPRSQNS
ncbi:MAG: acyltransferase [Devosia sp.]